MFPLNALEGGFFCINYLSLTTTDSHQLVELGTTNPNLNSCLFIGFPNIQKF